MFESDKRYVSAICHTKTCTLLTIKRSDLKILMFSNTKKVSKNSQPYNNEPPTSTDTLEDRLQILAWNKLISLSNKIKNLKEITENLGNQNKKQILVDDKDFEKVKYKIDREYEKIFLNQMTKMKIIKQSKAIKNMNKNEYPVTRFYNQLIMDEGRTDSKKKLKYGKA